MSKQTAFRSAASEWRVWRFLGAAHLSGIVIFLAVMAGFLWYVEYVEKRERQEALYRDIEWAQQSLRLHLRESRDTLSTMAPIWVAQASSGILEQASPRSYFDSDPQSIYMAYADPARHILWSYGAPGTALIPSRRAAARIDDSAGYFAFGTAIASLQAQFSAPFVAADDAVVVELYTPVVREQTLAGVLVTGFDLHRVLTNAVSEGVRSKYLLNIVDAGGNTLVSTSSSQLIDTRLSYGLPLEPPGSGMRLQAVAFDHGRGLGERLMQAGLLALTLTSLLSLVLLWRSGRDRMRIEAERDRLFVLSQDVLCVLTPDGTVVRGNPAFQEYFGADTTDTVLYDRIHPDDRAAVRKALSSRFDRIGPLEFRVRQRNTWRWLSWSISVDRRDAKPRLYAVAHDITRRKETEHALASETVFRRAMEDSISTGMRVIDQDGRITYVNRAFCRMIGYDESELIGQVPPYPYWLPEDEEINTQHLHVTVSGEAPAAGIQSRARRKDGRVLDIRMYVSPLIDDQGEQAGWMASMTDITEPNRIRAELAAAHERFNTVLDELPAAVSVASLVSPLLSPLPATTVSDATPIANLLANPLAPPGTDLLRRGADGCPTLLFANRQYRTLFGANASGHAQLLTGRHAADDWFEQEVHVPSIERWFEVRTRQIRWVDGQPVQLVVATDITAQRQIRELQDQQQEQLQQTSRLVTMGEMASSIAHELNQPLAAISNYSLGLAARLRRASANGTEEDPAQVLETLDKTAKQAQRAAAVIQRVRDFVKRSAPERRHTTVEALLAEAVGLAEIAAKRSRLAIVTRVAPNLPEINVDPILIEQVLLNLMKNAIDAMKDEPRRSVLLSVARRGDQIEFAVTDQGPGLTLEMESRLFEPFYTTKPEGMGMGLNICRSIIESHSGRLWVEPNHPRGCSFRFVLPTLEDPFLGPAIGPGGEVVLSR
ncbi:MAG: PAS domain S-box protein [Lautropia sp.]